MDPLSRWSCGRGHPGAPRSPDDKALTEQPLVKCDGLQTVQDPFGGVPVAIRVRQGCDASPESRIQGPLHGASDRVPATFHVDHVARTDAAVLPAAYVDDRQMKRR